MAGKPNEEVVKHTKNTEQNHADKGAALVDPECLIKHPLRFTWTLWYREQNRNSFEDTLNEVFSFSTMEDFWSLYKIIKRPADIKFGNDYSLFKKDIRPMWGDEENKRGGRWMANIPRQQRQELDKYWQNTILCLIGDAFESSEEICGAVVSVRRKKDTIAIWTANSQNREAVINIGRIYKERLGLQAPLEYRIHKDSMVISGSSVKAVYTL